MFALAFEHDSRNLAHRDPTRFAPDVRKAACLNPLSTDDNFGVTSFRVLRDFDRCNDTLKIDVVGHRFINGQVHAIVVQR